MARTSKEVFAEILDYAMEFESFGQDWCKTANVGAAGRARNYSKKLIEELRIFVKLTLDEEEAMSKAAVIALAEESLKVAAPVVEVVEVPKEVATPVVEVVVPVVEDKVEVKASTPAPKGTQKK
ncbi:hypothetical protein JZU46_02890 [bacterium]|nr:hypothetical protein [bacterium]